MSARPQLDKLTREGIGQAVKLDNVHDHIVSITASSNTSSQMSVNSGDGMYVRLLPEVDCHVSIGTSGTATGSNTPLMARVAEVFRVNSGDQVAVIQKGAVTGDLFLSEGV